MVNPFDLPGQGWLQVEELMLAFVLSALVGIEREMRQKSAGLRTHTLVGVSAALFMLISKYGFMDILSTGRIVLDPSRVAAQVVSGIGFIGGGIIFMRRDVVRGLTTAASVWFTAALGMACGAGLAVLGVVTMIGYGIIMFVFPILAAGLPKSRKLATELHVSYEDGRDLLRTILIRCTELRFAIDRVRLDQNPHFIPSRDGQSDLAEQQGGEAALKVRNIVTMTMLVKGKRPVSHLIASLSAIDGIAEVDSISDDSSLD